MMERNTRQTLEVTNTRNMFFPFPHHNNAQAPIYLTLKKLFQKKPNTHKIKTVKHPKPGTQTSHLDKLINPLKPKSLQTPKNVELSSRITIRFCDNENPKDMMIKIIHSIISLVTSNNE